MAHFSDDQNPHFVYEQHSSEFLQSYSVVRENWLTKKPNPFATITTALSTLFMSLGSLIYWSDFPTISNKISATHKEVFAQHEWWRLWTTLFAHADQKHLFGNLFLFYILGYFISGYFGIFVFPFLAFLFGGLINSIVLYNMPADVQLIGVSGVVFWMGGFWLILYFLIESRKSLLQRILRTLGVGLVLFMPSEAFDPNISYQSHLLGFALGTIAGIIYYFLNRTQILEAEVREIIYDD